MRKYVPNDRDREIVQHMSAIPGVTRAQIAYVITNERTGKPINERTLRKHFSKELEVGMAVMQQITMQSFVEQIKNHVRPATRLALSNYCALKDGADVAVNASIDNNMNVTFVASPHSREPNEPLPGPLPADARVALPPPIDVPIAPHGSPEPTANRYAFEPQEEPPAPRTEMDHGLRKGWYMDPPPTVRKKHWMG
jgi:hypothetical protein